MRRRVLADNDNGTLTFGNTAEGPVSDGGLVCSECVQAQVEYKVKHQPVLLAPR